jgi:hypothetical protein
VGIHQRSKHQVEIEGDLSKSLGYCCHRYLAQRHYRTNF